MIVMFTVIDHSIAEALWGSGGTRTQVQPVVLEPRFLVIPEPKPHKPEDPPVRDRLPEGDVEPVPAKHRGSSPGAVRVEQLGPGSHSEDLV
jgi:hypothetical protein